ncbi:MAG TPA: DNA recombination protein RmuC [Patescibacteria group bacterium]|nr:DNA recombination protein RmuC [Patescibacteria group bacterium]
MSDLFVIILAVVASAIVLLVFIRKWLTDAVSKTKPSEEIVEWLKEVSKRVETSTQAVDTKLTENMKNFNTRLDKAAYVIAQVQKNIGEFSEIGRSMKQLQDFLASPKLRGGIGETILKDLLQELLPKPSFVLQYGFKNGHTVDAIIKTSQGLIAIDAKFPLENFKKISSDASQKKDFVRDIKKHIQDIARKYILTAEGTLDYAIMYVPSESVYYEIISNEELYRFSGEKRVLMVSPMSFYAYLKAILMSFEGQKIEQRAREILSLLQNLKKDYEKSDEALSVLNRHITNAYNQVSNVSKFFLSLGQKLETTRLIEQSEEVKKLS